MTLRKHVRRAEPMIRGLFHHIECSCGWRGKVPASRRGRAKDQQALRDDAETVWLAHVPPRERRVYLLLDTRTPSDFRSLDDIREQLREEAGAAANEQLIDLKARGLFKAQRQIVGSFLMPEGKNVHVIEVVERDGHDYGRVEIAPDGTVEEWPVGEVRLADGRVFCAE